MKAESVEEIAVIAKENGEELSAEQAERLFEEIQARKAADELDENELSGVAGGMEEVHLAGVCKATVEGSMIHYDRDGNVTGFRSGSWCWFGTDACALATETYSEYKHY
ncbi:MAG: hypothetical protein IKG18_13630 [Atopobiaceae bacterium]|nr:hypothetical protein [Atopobiaceae bacterium]